MSGRTIIVTGGSSGIGKELCRLLCEAGNNVILAGRSEEKANATIEGLKKQNPNALVTFMQLDLTSKESVEGFVAAFKELDRKLFALVNNAGVNPGNRSRVRQASADGFELTVATNHIGPFYLTSLLLETLKESAAADGEARVINVTSAQHDTSAAKAKKGGLQPLDLDNMHYTKQGTYLGGQAYKDSKLAQVMFTYELARRLEGSKVSALAVCPGYVPSTDLSRSSSAASRFAMKYVGSPVMRAFKVARSATQGAQHILECVQGEKYKGVTGKYVNNGALADPSAEAKDEEAQAKLWKMTAGYLSMDGYDALEVPEVESPPPTPTEEKKEKSPKKQKKPKKGAKAEGEDEERVEEEQQEAGEQETGDGAKAEVEEAKEGDAEKKQEEETEKKDDGEEKGEGDTNKPDEVEDVEELKAKVIEEAADADNAAPTPVVEAN